MSRLADRLAAALRWAVTRMPESRREWGQALEAELTAVVAALIFAGQPLLAAIPLVYFSRRARRIMT